MDDLGADQLCKISCNVNKNEESAIFNHNTANTSESAIVGIASGDKLGRMGMKAAIKLNNSNKTTFNATEEDNIMYSSGPATFVASSNIDRLMGTVTLSSAEEAAAGAGVASSVGLVAMDEDSDEKEKTDATPENVKKIDDVIGRNYNNELPGNYHHYHPQTSSGVELKIVEDESPTKQSLAFTIEFSEGESSAASAAAATKYKNMVERFQNRHKRGASLSKLDDSHNSTSVTPTVSRTPRAISAHQNLRQQKGVTSENQSSELNDSEAGKVKLRIRERSTSGVRDASKRHSWSPRSSTHEPLDQQKIREKSIKKGVVINSVNKKSPLSSRQTTKSDKLSHNSVSVTSIKPTKKMDMSPRMEENMRPPASSFTPRSTALQLALNKVELLCPEPPLDNFSKTENLGDDCDSVSEAGTYTVDGDNYTEEQKEQMNIDKSTAASYAKNSMPFSDLDKDVIQMRPNELPLHTTTANIDNQRKNNVLEINYYHDSTSLKPKISYLEKIKSRVRNITKSPDKKLNSPSDIGMFTSVTTSGVLSIKPTLDFHPKINRRNSLTKSQIDSSEYISTESTLKCGGQSYSNAFTDHQKAEYKLNLFTNQTDSQILNESYDLDAPITPNSPTNSYSKSVASDTGLKSAQSKNDWIQEWARNARARSQSANTTTEQMSRSYNFEPVDSGFNDNQMNCVVYRNKPIDRFRNHGIGDFEYSSDPNVSVRKSGAEVTVNGNALSARPPMSPSKIPSPMHTVGRARSVSRTRGSLQDLSPLKSCAPETEVYLQKTAAAISNLAQSFSRKNSLHSTKSPSSTGNSPRHMFPQHYSADECSPTHATHHHNGHGGVHKRNLSLDYRNNLMSHSLNTETLATILDKQNLTRSRQHSYDSAVDSPKLFQRKAYIDQTGLLSNKHPHKQSPIRRSSSFSTKPITGGSVGKQQSTGNNRNAQKYSTHSETTKNPIQKSASSTSFRKMYSDYDDNVAYYINDEDDLVDEYCYSSDDFESEQDECYMAPAEPEPPEPLTNTRYNKALLMRIERSKQKVAGIQGKPTSGGVVACPNTPEMPRRAAQNTARSSVRQSVPRDSSLSRLKGEIPNSLASAKKQLLQTASSSTPTNVSKKVQPKYMDISKYKPVQGANFLRKDETKSTLTTRSNEIRRSPSSASVSLQRTDPTRVSNRSIKSASSRPGSSKREPSVPKQKEVELAMWKRRATYDPMKAAAEDRKRKEEARKLAQSQAKSTESSVVSRSQSFHSGVTLTSNSRIMNRSVELRRRDGFSNSRNVIADENNYRWTLTSTESSDGENEDADDRINQNEDEFDVV